MGSPSQRPSTSDFPDFLSELATEVLSNSYHFVRNNVDPWRFPEKDLIAYKVKEQLLAWFSALGFYRAPWSYRERLRRVLDAGPFDAAMRAYADDASRRLLVQLLAFRILGERHYRLATNTPEFWKSRRKFPDCVEERAVIRDVPQFDGCLDRFNCGGIRLVDSRLHVFNTFVAEQYRCRRADIGVRPGDTVIDGGACWGDTSLYFARHADRVFAYECMPEHLNLFKMNLESNPALAQKIALMPKALGKESGKTLFFEEHGGASRASVEGQGVAVLTESIDDLARAQNLSRVDFIKMDIEGAEMDALLGARETLRRFRPRLAICVYHSLQDMVRIPAWIANLGLGYHLYLDHFSIYGEETVLFAVADSK